LHTLTEKQVTTLSEALGLIKGYVGFLNAVPVVRSRTIPNNNADTRVLLESYPAEGKRLDQNFKKTTGHLLGFVRGGQSLGQVEEFVAPEAT
jgi:hypothetical protein